MAQLSETSSVLWQSLSCSRLGTVFRAFNALGMINGAAAHCTPRVIEPAVFWRLQRVFLSLCLIKVAVTFWTLYPFKDILDPFLLCPECNLWQNILRWGVWGARRGLPPAPSRYEEIVLMFFRCLVCYAFHILFSFFDSEIIFLSTWLKANPLEGSLCWLSISKECRQSYA